MGHLLIGLFAVIDNILGIYVFILFVSIILKMVRADSSNPLVKGVYILTDPACAWILKKFPRLYLTSNDGTAMDLSPTALIVGIGCLKIFLPHLRDFLLGL